MSEYSKLLKSFNFDELYKLSGFSSNALDYLKPFVNSKEVKMLLGSNQSKLLSKLDMSFSKLLDEFASSDFVNFPSEYRSGVLNVKRALLKDFKLLDDCLSNINNSAKLRSLLGKYVHDSEVLDVLNSSVSSKGKGKFPGAVVNVLVFVLMASIINGFMIGLPNKASIRRFRIKIKSHKKLIAFYGAWIALIWGTQLLLGKGIGSVSFDVVSHFFNLGLNWLGMKLGEVVNFVQDLQLIQNFSKAQLVEKFSAGVESAAMSLFNVLVSNSETVILTSVPPAVLVAKKKFKK